MKEERERHITVPFPSCLLSSLSSFRSSRVPRFHSLRSARDTNGGTERVLSDGRSGEEPSGMTQRMKNTRNWRNSRKEPSLAA